MKEYEIVVATDADNGIGKDGRLPWHLPKDLKFFRNLTTKTETSGKKNAVIMGRKTWESIPKKFRPLPGRINVVLTKNKKLPLPMDVVRGEGIDEALALLEKPPLSEIVERIFVIGGAQIYREAIKKSECRSLHITQILDTFDCDVFFPAYHVDFDRTHLSKPYQENDLTFYFAEFQRKPKEDTAKKD